MAKGEALFRALADKTRLNIVKLLVSGEKCVCEIYPNIKRTQSTVSIQLMKLEDCGIIASRRSGKFTYYSIKDKKIGKIFKLLGIKTKKYRKMIC